MATVKITETEETSVLKSDASFLIAQKELVDLSQKKVLRRIGKSGFMKGLNIDELAKPDGYYSTLTVGTAENLIGRGTVSASYTRRTSGGDASIGSGAAQIKSIKGNTLVWNQLVKNGNFADTSEWIEKDSGIFSVSNSVGTLTQVQSTYNGFIRQPLTSVSGHKYLYNIWVKKNSDLQVNFGFRFAENAWTTVTYLVATTALDNTFKDFKGIVEASGDGTSVTMGIGNYIVGELLSLSFRDCYIIDLTQMFGAGNEPSTVAEFEALFPESYYDYDAGSLLNMTADGIRTTGFNQWDEEWEVGALDGTNGQPVFSATDCRSVNFTSVFPNTQYYFKTTGDAWTRRIFFYDHNKNYISNNSFSSYPTLFTTPANCGYIKLHFGSTLVAPAETSINLSWSGYRDGDYEAYWSSKLDLPISTYFPDGMKSAGTVRDEITPSKSVKRVGAVDLGTLDWRAADGVYRAVLSDLAIFTDQNAIGPLVTRKYITTTYNLRKSKDKQIACIFSNAYGNVMNIYVYDEDYATVADFKTGMSGETLYYAVAEPVETPISPPLNLNYRVDDFGTEEITGESASSPIIYDVQYSMNAVDVIRNLPRNVFGKESWDDYAGDMNTLGVSITSEYDADTEAYDFDVAYTRAEQLVDYPSSASSSGTKGNLAIADSTLAVCTDTGSWKKLTLSTW